MPRKVTDKIVAAFLAGKTARQSNTSTDGTYLSLHGNDIAKIENGDLWVSNAGWNTRTTYERLNGIPGVSISVKQGIPYLNGVKWDGKWINVGPVQTSEQTVTEGRAKVKRILKTIIKEEVKRALSIRRLREAGESDWVTPKGGHPESYYIAYYATVGEHGEAEKFSRFEQAYQMAVRHSKDTDFMEGLEYLGVEATWEGTPDFAVVFVTDSYIKRVSANMFKNPADYKTFISVAKKCLQTGKPTKGTYDTNKTESVYRRRSIKEQIAVDKSNPKNIETGVSNLFLKGAGYDTNGNLRIVVGFPNDKGTSIQTNGNLPETDSILSSNGGRYAKLSKLSDNDIVTIGKEVTEYIKMYGSNNMKSRLSIYGQKKTESRNRTRSSRLSEATGLHPDVLNSYLETALWSSNDESDDSGGQPFDANYDITDIAPQSIAQAKKDIAEFIQLAEQEGVLNPYLDAFTGPSWGNFGHDFWLTRNGHGAGFWDRSEIDDEVGKKLTDICDKHFKEIYPVLGDDGKIYFE